MTVVEIFKSDKWLRFDFGFSAGSKRSGHRVDSSHHKKALQQYIREHDQKNDSGIEEDRDLQSDDAVELLGMTIIK